MLHASGRWGLVRADWVDHPDVGANEIAVLSVLTLYVGRDGTCYPSQATLAARLKVSRSWVIRALNRLAELGLVRREQRRGARGRSGSCLYTIEGHAEATKAACRDMRRQPGNATPTREADVIEDIDADHLGVAPNGVASTEHEQRAKPESGLSQRARGARTRDEGPALKKGEDKTVPPTNWTPTDEDRAFTAEHAPELNVDGFAVLFVQSCHAHGYRYADHSAAFRAWVLNRWRKSNVHSHAHRDHAHRDQHPLPGHRAAHQTANRSSRPADGRDFDHSAANRDTALAALALLAR
jgi:DNA-binding MarR family transcriptional regulator